jgi:hypothetical protein
LLKCAIAAAREGANIVVADLKSDINKMQEIKIENSKAILSIVMFHHILRYN